MRDGAIESTTRDRAMIARADRRLARQPGCAPVDLLRRRRRVGLRTRRLRAALSALGIAIGIAAMVAVLGISESSRADLLAELDRARHEPAARSRPGQTFFGDDADAAGRRRRR